MAYDEKYAVQGRGILKGWNTELLTKSLATAKSQAKSRAKSRGEDYRVMDKYTGKVYLTVKARKENPSPKSLIGATILSLKRTASGTIKELKLRLKPSATKRKR